MADPAARLTDEELVRRVLGGDEWATEVLFRRHAGVVIGTATRLLSNASEAEDVAQDTFIVAFEKLSQLREPGAFRGWVLQIAVRQVHKRLRRRRVFAWVGIEAATSDPIDALAAADAGPEVRAELAILAPKLAALKPKDRMAWTLRYVEGHSLAEVAELTETSLATAKRRIHHAQERLGVRLGRGSSDE
ncbi:MAG: sigma-70 family RNA polymerase sigma factor [Deltaproteobacteria bacterium]|nr:sigma-70 family RNA polymerase sigma factor [Deltaproteobacteria bacterium]